MTALKLLSALSMTLTILSFCLANTIFITCRRVLVFFQRSGFSSFAEDWGFFMCIPISDFVVADFSDFLFYLAASLAFFVYFSAYFSSLFPSSLFLLASSLFLSSWSSFLSAAVLFMSAIASA